MEIPEEVSLDVPSIVRLHGYGCEEIRVTTTDGYQLMIIRILNFDTPGGKSKPAVLLQHGLLADAAAWVSIGYSFQISLFQNLLQNLLNILYTWKG